ncbi:MAG: SBBP repeat-containing protein, partial [Planctomycetaceae bacterium]|nr:SBBP repeat-containing protein [Planctomycetaceae bacterium]
MSLISRLVRRQRNTSRSCRSGFLSVGGASSAARSRRSLRIEPLEVRSLLSVGVSGVVWNDANANGIRDVGEPGIAGAVIELINNPPAEPWTQYSGGVLGVAITDADGRYQLSNLPDSTYLQAQVRVPTGYTFTQKVVNDGAIVSDVRADGYTDHLPVELRSPVEGDLDTPIIVGDGENHSEVTVNAGVVGAAPAFGSAFNLGATGQNTFANGIATDADGNIYLTGSFGGIVDFDPGPGHMNRNSEGQNDVFVAKYTSSGSLLWLREFGGAGYDRGTAL